MILLGGQRRVCGEGGNSTVASYHDDHYHVRSFEFCSCAKTAHMYLPHVDFIERGQHGTLILGLLQSLGNSLPHPVHLDLGKV